MSKYPFEVTLTPDEEAEWREVGRNVFRKSKEREAKERAKEDALTEEEKMDNALMRAQYRAVAEGLKAAEEEYNAMIASENVVEFRTG